MIKQIYDFQLNDEFVTMAKKYGLIIYGAGRQGASIVAQLLGLQFIRGGGWLLIIMMPKLPNI